MGGYHQLKTARCIIGLRIDRATQADTQEAGTLGGRGRGLADGGETVGGVRLKDI